MLFFNRNRTITKYQEYRETGKALNHKIIDRFVDRVIMLSSGKYLGLVGHGKRKTLIFDNESESAGLMDFCINEYNIDGKNAAQLYKENEQLDDIEAEILDALVKSYTSLFKVIDVKEEDNKLILVDLLNKNCNPIEIIDIGLSLTAPVGLLIFLRLVPLADFNISGGFGFGFNGDLEDFLLKEYKLRANNVKSSSESLKRYVAFFKLNRRYGIEAEYR
jgi:hypothetical protein